jgi:pimeloyl-ACP methyl ester carboxylesterase
VSDSTAASANGPAGLAVGTTADGRAATGVARNGEVPIFYRRFGTPERAQDRPAPRTPVLVVHGLSYFSYDWIDVACALAADREVVAVDMRGFGDSGVAATGDYSVPANARDFVAVLDHLGWTRAVLLGHSMGGRHCLWCASTHPGRVAALVAVDFAPAVDPAGAARVARSVGTQPDAFADLDACIAWFTGAPASAATNAVRRRFEQYTHPVAGGVAIKRDLHFRDQFRRILETGERPPPGVDLWQALRALACPALFVRGRDSDMFAAATVDKVRDASSRAEVVELATGHDVAGQDPRGLVRETQAFFARHRL